MASLDVPVPVTVNETRQPFTEISKLKTTLLIGSTPYTVGGFGRLNHTDNLLQEANDHMVSELVSVIVYLILLMIVGTLGNSITCYIYTTKMKRTTTNLFILWLTILDLSSCLFGIPFDMFDIVFADVFDQPIVCKVARLIIYFTNMTSLLTLLAISVDRYYKICKPLKKPPTKRARYFVIGSAISGIIFAIPTLYIYGTNPGDGGYACKTDRALLYSVFVKIYFGVLFLINITSMLFLLTLYICVGFQVRKRSLMKIGDNADSKTVVKKNNRNYANRPKYKLHRATAWCVAITIAFVVSFFPTLILNVISTNNDGFEESLSGSSFIAFNLFLRNYFLSNVTNPIIYGFLNPTFRKECFLMLRRLNACRHP